MEILNTYKNYRQHEIEYNKWAKDIQVYDAKKKIYLEKNPLSQVEKENALEKGKILINAIDIMDEYSQTKAEDTEIVTNILSEQIQLYLTFLGMGLATFLATKFPPLSKSLDKYLPNQKLNFSLIMGGIIAGIASIPIVSLATKAKIGSSRQGRFEAMKNELGNEKMFAQLTDKQKEKTLSEAKKIELSQKELYSLQKNNLNTNLFSFVSTVKGLIKDKEIYENERQNFEKKLEKNKLKILNTLDKDQITNLKKDTKLLTNIANKIDIASQDYAENVELFTNIANILMFSTGILSAKLTNKILCNLKLNKIKNGKVIKGIITTLISITPLIITSSYFTTIQKHTSRLGRFNAKQELLKNPINFIQIEEEKLDKINISDSAIDVKKNSFRQFIKQLVKDHKDYQNYIKTEAIENKKINKAILNINLDEHQTEDAKNLQLKTFETFNEIDEMSQKYAESVEAIGEIAQNTFGTMFKSIGIIIGSAIAFKPLLKGNYKHLNYTKMLTTQMCGALCGIVPAILIEIYTTKEQKKASRIANMLATKNLNNKSQNIEKENPQIGTFKNFIKSKN